eukprot:TRINITY_DN24821_c3_g1_i1.p1 TRINITY_DN24821_c3_g1~~TRINITY_DN24821_c3_g1_i1.p1  ORF type:complete len:165 (+),score=17.30 TRINITY_DN24821_c3_g1_i1:179-673(+)
MVPLPFSPGECVAPHNVGAAGWKEKQSNFLLYHQIILLRRVRRMRLCNVAEEDPKGIFICLGWKVGKDLFRFLDLQGEEGCFCLFSTRQALCIEQLEVLKRKVESEKSFNFSSCVPKSLLHMHMHLYTGQAKGKFLFSTSFVILCSTIDRRESGENFCCVLACE